LIPRTSRGRRDGLNSIKYATTSTKKQATPMKKTFPMTLVAIILSCYSSIIFATIKIIAAENIYGSIAKQIGGEYVEVTNILNNPSQDPHLFTTTPSIAKAITNADMIIYNGGNYDPWMMPLIPKDSQKNILNVAELAHIPPDSNPHIWYSPDVMVLFAKKITDLLISNDPEHQKIFTDQLRQFEKDYQKIFLKIAIIKNRFKDTAVIATESVFNEMIESCGLIMRGKNFQIKMMNDIPPSIADIKEFELDLRQHRVHALIYNEQVINPLTQKMLDLARQEKIPIVGVTEMMPPNLNYIDWILKELNDLDNALEGNFSA
jgi:zinc/manganese transport system substrate-binding protein